MYAGRIVETSVIEIGFWQTVQQEWFDCDIDSIRHGPIQFEKVYGVRLSFHHLAKKKL